DLADLCLANTQRIDPQPRVPALSFQGEVTRPDLRRDHGPDLAGLPDWEHAVWHSEGRQAGTGPGTGRPWTRGSSRGESEPSMSLVILGLGTALPEPSVTQQRAAELTSQYSGHDAEQTRRLAVLYRRTGISKRHIVLLDRADLPLAVDGQRGP